MLTFRNPALKNTFEYLRNFGFQGEIEVVMPGTNAKMNEMQALMGESILPHMPGIVAARRMIADRYWERLRETPGLHFPAQLPATVEYNFSYMPIEIDAAEFGLERDELYALLRSHNVFARRYFYPLICDYACYRGVRVNDPLPVARRVSERILALPMYADLSLEAVDRICEIISEGSRT